MNDLHEEAPQDGDEPRGGSGSKRRSRGADLLTLLLFVLFGALGGGLIGYVSYTPDPSCAPTAMWDAPCDYGAGFDAMADAFWGGLIGFVVGLVVIVLARGARDAK
jgi:hypothetical protein